MKRSILTACAVTVLCATPSLADTRYDMSAALCGFEASDSSLTLADDTVTFYESTCTVTDRKVVSDSVSDLALSCGGEGETWERALRIEQTAAGLRLTDENGTLDYVSCN